MRPTCDLLFTPHNWRFNTAQLVFFYTAQSRARQPKALKEVRGFLPSALDADNLEWLTEEEATLLAAAKDRQQRCIRRFLGHEPGQVISNPAVYRVATHRLLQAIDHALWAVTGFGFEQFASADTKVDFLDPAVQVKVADFVAGPFRSCQIVADQFSCGPTGVSFLQSKGYSLLADLLFDPPHRFWNFEKLGLLAGGGWEAILLTSIVYSVNDGPWGGSGFLQQLQNAKEEYLALVEGRACQLFQHLLPFVARDQDREGELGPEDFQAEMWNLIKHAKQLTSKGPKPALCRWYSWLDAHRYWSKWYHIRLLLFLYWSMGCGLLKKNTIGQGFGLTTLPQKGAYEGKETMREQAAKQARVNAKGKNRLHVSLMILMNPLVHRRANVAYWVLQSMRDFHGRGIIECETPEGNREWSCRMAEGAFLQPLYDSWQILSDPVRLEACGFLCSLTTAARAGYTEGGPLEEDEGSWATWIVFLLASLTRNRLRHLLFYQKGPGLLAGLLAGDADRVQECLGRVGRLWRAFVGAADANCGLQVGARKKSWMARPLIAEIFSALAEAGFERVPEEILVTLRVMFSMVSTKCIEDGFQRLRVQETRGQSSRVVRLDRMWHTLVTKGVLSRVHKFPEISFRDIGEKRALEELPRQPPQSLYKPSSRKPALKLHDVSSEAQAVIPAATIFVRVY